MSDLDYGPYIQYSAAVVACSLLISYYLLFRRVINQTLASCTFFF